jgi:hypothetical protein
MNFTKKYLVVPYVQNLEKPSESHLENLNKNMTDIIQDKNIPSDQKIKLYNKNLNEFLLKYDSDSFGVAPTLTKIANLVTKFVEDNNSNSVQNELSNVFENNINSSQINSLNSNYNTPMRNNLTDSIIGTDKSLNTSNKISNSRLSKTDSIQSDPNLSEDFSNLFENNNNSLIIPTASNFAKQKKALIEDNNFDSFGFPKGTNPTANLRSKGFATHQEGLQTRSLNLPANVTLPSPISPNQNFINSDRRDKKNKYKNNSSSNSSNGKKQTGRGFVWKTKKFF